MSANTKVPAHVPRFEHECPVHGWETCATGDPSKPHACSLVVSLKLFDARIREEGGAP